MNLEDAYSEVHDACNLMQIAYKKLTRVRKSHQSYLLDTALQRLISARMNADAAEQKLDRLMNGYRDCEHGERPDGTSCEICREEMNKERHYEDWKGDKVEY